MGKSRVEFNKMLKNAQSALEYLMIIALTFAIIVPTVYLFFTYARESNIKIIDSQIDRIGRNIVNTAESIYYSGEHSKTILEFNMPDNIEEVNILSNRELVFTIVTEFGNTDIVFFSDVNIISDDCDALFEECSLSSIASKGFQKVKIESVTDGTQVRIQQELE